MRAKEIAGNQRRKNGAAPARFTGAVSVRSGNAMSACNLASNPTGAGGRGALRSNNSIRSSFIDLSFNQVVRSSGASVCERRKSSAARRRYLTVLVAMPRVWAVSFSERP